MTELPGARLDDRLRRLDRRCREVAQELRPVGMALDADPDSVTEFLHLPAFQLLQQAFTPKEYWSGGDLLGVEVSGSALDWAVILEAISYGDPGAILANYGPGLSRDLIIALGDQDQRDLFFGRLAERPTWTFFGLTEPFKGSAALELESSLTADGDSWLLNGDKRYVGNGARAQMGVVFARRAPGPWGIEAVLIDTSDPGFSGALLPMMGLRGARISRLHFDDVVVPPDRVLGRHRPPSRRGLYGALQALHRFRPGLGAMTLGVVQAVCDYVRAELPSLPPEGRYRLDAILDRTAVTRRMVHDVSAEIDAGIVNTHRIGAVKMRAAQLGEDATLLAAELLGPGSLIEHPWLEKAYRDVRGFEFMEGTSNLHRLSVFQGLLRNDYFAA
ncbi:acyl-CoA dehydrogenase family protein [Kibdelosporangium phytohabitans]|uniref:Acyl-CoA dehydrogenase n=1 Tax=Kibdelosporangium phytohabitans TaxID=860235 RepID=A0A0N9I3F8_9PSEU|nr:acyl-CoA dehydrogenase [Kibdelosporangium phytohabitans]ALG10437.1 acyl-CoA dehydrogenase [Kibdelosporangium phytohabitans]MBE1461509.1 alkylation response protein AidB-like acyl-CoA dehydrogenase [Kibdelosporangium phytohabitans]